MRNYIMTFWIGVEFEDSQVPTPGHESTICIAGSLEDLRAQVAAALEAQQSHLNRPWTISGYFQAIAGAELDFNFAPERYYWTLNKGNLLEWLQRQSEVASGQTSDFQLEGQSTDGKRFWLDNPKKDWSNGE